MNPNAFHRLVAFGRRAGGWLIWFFLCGAGMAAAGQPVPLAVPLGLLAGAAHAFIASRRRSPVEDATARAVLDRFARRPANAERARSARRRAALFSSAAAGLALAALAAGGLMTAPSARTRGILLSAAGAAAPPESPDQLSDYLRVAENADAAGGGTALAEELKRRYSESYFDLKTVPAVDRLQDDALAAVRSGDAKRLGNALLMLVLARDGLASALRRPALTEERRAFLRNVALSLGLTTEDEQRQLRAFLGWAARKDWMPEAHDALLRFERHIVGADRSGAWLARWAGSIPPIRGVPVPRGEIAPEWTWRGHAAAKELAEAADPEWAAAALAGYRQNALAAWTDAADALRDGLPENIPDADLAARLREAGAGNGPASRFAALAREHLSPMFGAADAPDYADAAVWPALSPAAADSYARSLRARQSALDLDAAWRRTVYTPGRFGPGGPARDAELLQHFLTGPADGFWEWTGPDDDRIGNARSGDGVPSVFSREFLDYCNAVLARARNPDLAELPLALGVDAVTVSGENIVERPSAVAFRLGSRRAGKEIVYRNYPVTGDWLWTPDIAEAEIRVAFPSHTAVLSFTTPEELRDFCAFFGEGPHALTPEAFGPGSARVLRALGVRGITISAALTNREKLLAQLSRPALPPLPKSIVPAKKTVDARKRSPLY